jgi:hypothetical protein
MTIKSTLAAGFTAAVLAFATSPASANANIANDLETAGSTAARLDVTPSGYRYYCNCARVRYVRYYRVRYVRYVYRYYY